jgi:hypothetical protein
MKIVHSVSKDMIKDTEGRKDMSDNIRKYLIEYICAI